MELGWDTPPTKEEMSVGFDTPPTQSEINQDSTPNNFTEPPTLDESWFDKVYDSTSERVDKMGGAIYDALPDGSDINDMFKSGLHGGYKTLDLGADVLNFFNPLTPAYPTEQTKAAREERNSNLPTRARPKSNYSTAGEILFDPLNVSPAPIAKVITHPLENLNKLGSKLTEPVMDFATKQLYKPSHTGSIADDFKTNFVQDYKLPDSFVKNIDTETRTHSKQMGDVIEEISKNLNEYSTADREMIEYLAFRDGVAFPVAELRYKQAKMNSDDFSPFPKLIKRADALKNQVWKNEDKLIELGMLDSNMVHQSRGGLFKDLEGGGTAYSARNYLNRDKLVLDKTLPAGRTIEGKRGLYDDKGNKVRDWTKQERASMSQSKNAVAEKTLAKQSDSIVQGQVMQDTLANYGDDFVKTKESMKKFVGGEPKTKQDGFELLQGKEYGNLSGHYIQQQMANRLKSVVDDIDRTPGAWNEYRKYISEWKQNLTIKNPKTHVNNVLGNVGMMITASDIPTTAIPGILKNGYKSSDALKNEALKELSVSLAYSVFSKIDFIVEIVFNCKPFKFILDSTDLNISSRIPSGIDSAARTIRLTLDLRLEIICSLLICFAFITLTVIFARSVIYSSL